MSIRTSASHLDNTVRLGKVQVGGMFPDSLTGRLRLEQNLEANDFIPPSLPPGGLLVVKQLRIQIRQSRGLSAIPPGYGAPVQSALDGLTRQAARPARGMTPAGAEAVLFANPAELLACLGADAVDWNIGVRWWWKKISPPAGSLDDVLGYWAAAPEWIPEATVLMRNMGKLSEFGRMLPEREAACLLNLIVERYALPNLPGGRKGSFTGIGKDQNIVSNSDHKTHHQSSEKFESETRAFAAGTIANGPNASYVQIWQDLMGGIWPDEFRITRLPAHSALLFGISLSLAFAPEKLRIAINAMEDFGLSWRQVCAQFYSEPSKGDDVLYPPEQTEANRNFFQTPSTPITGQGVPVEVNVGSHPAGEINITTNPTQEKESTQTRMKFHDQIAGTGAFEDQKLSGEEPGNRPLDAKEGFSTESRNKIGSFVLSPESQSPQAKPQAADAKANSKGEAKENVNGHSEIHTAYGGLFYLINLALYLGLYQDFGPVHGINLSLSLWDFLALIGYSWMGPELKADPLWVLLAEFGGRQPNEPPGGDFFPEPDWRIPTAWLKPFGSTAVIWNWCIVNHPSGARLCVEHPAGFKVLDLALKNQDSRQLLQMEMRPYRLSNRNERIRLIHKKVRLTALEIYKLETEPVSCIAWLERLLPYLSARLRIAFGLENSDPAIGGQAEELLCVHPARVVYNSARVDIFLRLAGLPVEIRYAGLDRDPWWVPAARHFIAFHFD